jgi:hypothetical protein
LGAWLDRALGIAGIVLGLPSFLILFLDGFQAVAVITLILAAVLIIAAAIVRWYLRLPEYTMKHVEVTLKFLDDVGAQAVLIKKYRIRPNSFHSREIIHRNNAADGDLINIRWNGQLVPQGQIAEVLGEFEIKIDFLAPKPWWRSFDGELSYDLVNSFPGEREGLRYVVDFPATKVSFKIEMPSNRPCTDVEATSRAGGEKVLPRPKVTNGGKLVTMSVKRPYPGGEYRIAWRW